MDKLLLVDGSNLLFQMFFGMPSRIINRTGKPIQGTMGFVGALLKIIRMIKPSHVAVLFDGEHENERVSLNADYKANRIDYGQLPENECPFSHLDDIKNALDYLNIRHAETTLCEVDDWIACYALNYGKDIKVVISSFDSDYFQLLSDNVSVLRYRGIKTAVVTPDYLLENLGVTPAQYADYKSLVGDVSDNIRGAEGVGPKTAAWLLNKFGTLENIIANSEQIERRSIRESVSANSEKLMTNYRIIKLSNEVDLPYRLDELTYSDNKLTTSLVLNGIGLLP